MKFFRIVQETVCHCSTKFYKGKYKTFQVTAFLRKSPSNWELTKLDRQYKMTFSIKFDSNSPRIRVLQKLSKNSDLTKHIHLQRLEEVNCWRYTPAVHSKIHFSHSEKDCSCKSTFKRIGVTWNVFFINILSSLTASHNKQPSSGLHIKYISDK